MKVEVFLSMIKTSEGCQTWEGACSGKDAGGGAGYGCVRIGKERWLTHILAYTLTKGPVPKGMLVCHRCNNTKCMNPEHLYLGTNAQNMADGARDGLFLKRAFYEGEVWLMKRLRTFNIPYTKIAAMFKADYHTIWDAVNKPNYTVRKNPC